MILEEKITTFQKTGDFGLGKDILDVSHQLAESIIYKKYRNFGYTDDLFSESHDAIVSAIYAFEVDKNTKFLTFCSACINNRIKNFIKRVRVREKYQVSSKTLAKSSVESLDLLDSLRDLSGNHFNCLMYGEGSKSMRYRAKQKVFNQLNE